MAAKPGKYDHIIDDLKPAPPQDAPYQQRVDEAKKMFAEHAEGCPFPYSFDGCNCTPTFDALKLADSYIGLRRQKDRLEADEKALNLRIEACTQLLVASQDRGEEAWGKYGVKDNALRLENGATIRVHSEPYGQVKDKEAFRLWCIANGYERQLQLWPSTMNALAKERRVNGDPDPDGVEVFRKEQVKYIAAGKEE